MAFFDIDKTLAELKNIHGKAIKTLFKIFFDKDFEGIEEVYFRGFRLGNSFREFDCMVYTILVIKNGLTKMFT